MSKPKTILVVEGDPLGRDYLVCLLRNSGYEVEEAGNGREALEKLQTFSPDLVLSDVLMPEMDGLELLHRLRSGSSVTLANVPVIFYSASQKALEMQQAVSPEATAQKAFNPAASEVILTAISNALTQPGPVRPFDSKLFAEEQIRRLSEQLVDKVQELTRSKDELANTAALLRKSEEQYRLLFENNPNPMWVFDQEALRFLAVNEAAVIRYGHARDEFLQMTIRDICPGFEQERLDRELTAGLLDRMVAPESWRHQKKDGSLLDVEIFSHKITFAGRPANLVMAQDLSERTKLESQLRQSQKMEVIGQLASGIAHDFNNLLGVIMGCTELALLRLDETSPAAEKLLDVKSAAQRAAGLTRQLLLFSRQEISEPRILDLNKSITSFGQFLHRLIGEDIELTYVLSQEPAHVVIDPGLLEQVLMNLIVNARHAMPEGGRITIHTARTDLTAESCITSNQVPGAYVVLTITDTGQGMTASTLARIFEPFFTTKERGKGTGLGLATVHTIVKQAGGHITVLSESGLGTTFKVFLPLSGATPEHLDAAENVTDLKGVETILLVEDEPSLRLVLRESLQQNGYKVLTAGSGLEALVIADRPGVEINLLVTDVIMLGMSGPELVKRMQTKYPGIRVLLMSGYTDQLVRDGLMGSTHLVHKPCTRVAFLQKVRSVLEESSQYSVAPPMKTAQESSRV